MICHLRIETLFARVNKTAKWFRTSMWQDMFLQPSSWSRLLSFNFASLPLARIRFINTSISTSRAWGLKSYVRSLNVLEKRLTWRYCGCAVLPHASHHHSYLNRQRNIILIEVGSAVLIDPGETDGTRDECRVRDFTIQRSTSTLVLICLNVAIFPPFHIIWQAGLMHTGLRLFSFKG